MRHAAVWLAAAALATPASAQSEAEARIDSIFARWDSAASPGCAVGVYHAGQIVLAKGYGMANLEHAVPIRPASIFHVASISKQFAAFSIVLLAREGRLSLDDEVRRHVTELPHFGRRITIRHLLHHTSGLRDQWELLSLAGWRGDDPKSESDILGLLARQKDLNFEPGAEYLYSNSGYTLLAVIVQRVTGKTLRTFADERIFRPLGMTRTHFHDDHTMVVPGRTAAYVPRDSGWAISIPVFDNHGATSLFTTVEDLARWDANFSAPVVGGAGVIEQMHERGRLNDGTTLDYGFALAHGEVRGLRTVGHSGSDAGYRADYLRFPDTGWSFATLCNTPVSAGDLNRRVAEVYLGERMAPPPQPRGPTVVPQPQSIPPATEPVDRAAFTGEWYSDELDTTWSIRLDGERLSVERRRFAARTLEPMRGDTLRSGNWILAFQRDGSGRTTGFRLTTGRIRNLVFARIPSR
ncbi:MAG: beta-lactamase family protein [Gemmatimonadetes bacterium]|nr:beta-lactamase family protein [Gemmatimonadota bacterium]